MLGGISKGVTLYTAGTPNGWKLSVLLKELKYPHRVKALSFSKDEQKQDWFLKINPNGRIPAIVDHDNDDFPIFESGACMMYLSEKAGQFYPQDCNKRYEVNQWLFFLNAGVGPMQGQANHFVRFAKEKLEYPMNRYVGETKRLFSVLEDRLKENEWLAAGEYTIADIATYCWVVCSFFPGIALDEFPALKAWVERIKARPAVAEGMDVPEGNEFGQMCYNDEAMREKCKEAQDIIASVSTQ